LELDQENVTNFVYDEKIDPLAQICVGELELDQENVTNFVYDEKIDPLAQICLELELDQENGEFNNTILMYPY
jgi:hypothetical protein